MSPEKQRALSSKGGASVPREKRSFTKDPTYAAAVGRKGGSTPKRRRLAP